MRYTSKRSRTHATIGKLHRTIKSNAMVVDMTGMQAGPADLVQALTIRNYKHGAMSGLALPDADECEC